MGEHLIVNLITVGAEVIVAILLVIVLHLVLRRIIDAVARRPSLQRFEAVARSLRANAKALFKLIGFVGVLGIIGVNVWLMTRGELLHAYTLDLVRSVPSSFWIALAIGVAEVLALCIVAALVLRRVQRLLDAIRDRAKAIQGITANNEPVDRFFDAAQKVAARAGWLGVLVLSSVLLNLPDAAASGIRTVFEIYLVIAAALLVWNAVDVAIISLDALSKKHVESGGLLRHYERFGSLVPLLRRCVEYGIYVGAATLVTLRIDFDAVAAYGPRIIRVIGVIFISRAAIELASLVLEEVIVNRPKLDAAQKQRRLTILPLFKSVARYGIYFGSAVFILGEFGVNLTPILAGAGIVAMAVGLGAQSVVHDLVCGFFILFENYFLVGDYVAAGGAQGIVDQIDLRTTRIRDDAGRLHIVRNGNIDSIVNYSKDYTRAVVSVGVAYEADLQDVFAVLREIGEQLAADRDEVLEATRVAGVDQFGDSSVDVLTTTMVKPGQHRVIERELRQRIKATFDARGIEIPYPRRYVIMDQPAEEPEEPEEAKGA